MATRGGNGHGGTSNADILEAVNKGFARVDERLDKVDRRLKNLEDGSVGVGRFSKLERRVDELEADDSDDGEE